MVTLAGKTMLQHCWVPVKCLLELRKMHFSLKPKTASAVNHYHKKDYFKTKGLCRPKNHDAVCQLLDYSVKNPGHVVCSVLGTLTLLCGLLFPFQLILFIQTGVVHNCL